MKKIFLIALFILGNIVQSFSQRDNDCGSQTFLDGYLRRFPAFRENITRIETFIRNRIENYPLNPQLHRNAIIIPVVVHVIHTNENIVSDAQIRSQITALNNFFRKRNVAEIAAIPSADFRRRASDCYLEFQLARRKPDGTATNGIVRVRTTKTMPFSYADCLSDNPEVKRAPNGSAPWDTQKYLNIWVSELDGLRGVGSFPWDPFPERHGVLMDHRSFGTTGTVVPPYNRGVTNAHEVGHFLGLWHIWGDKAADSACDVDDDVADTPPQQTRNYDCPTFPHPSCPTGQTADGDMFHNLMDYTHCRCMFTRGQAARLLSVFAPGGPRASLALSNALMPPGSTSINHEVFGIAETSTLPSWKAAMAMVWATARQMTPDVDGLERASGGFSINGLPSDVSTTIHALVLNYQEVLVCYSVEGFRNLLRRGPMALVSIGSGDKYGLVVSGMSVAPNGSAMLTIKDPMSVGPRFGINQTGAEYQVDYATFMTQNLEQLARDNKKIFIIYPPSTGGI